VAVSALNAYLGLEDVRTTQYPGEYPQGENNARKREKLSEVEQQMQRPCYLEVTHCDRPRNLFSPCRYQNPSFCLLIHIGRPFGLPQQQCLQLGRIGIVPVLWGEYCWLTWLVQPAPAGYPTTTTITTALHRKVTPKMFAMSDPSIPPLHPSRNHCGRSAVATLVERWGQKHCTYPSQPSFCHIFCFSSLCFSLVLCPFTRQNYQHLHLLQALRRALALTCINRQTLWKLAPADHTPTPCAFLEHRERPWKVEILTPFRWWFL
jgi:hypothetical protein